MVDVVLFTDRNKYYPVQGNEHNHLDSLQKSNRIFMLFLNSIDSSHCQSWNDYPNN